MHFPWRRVLYRLFKRSSRVEYNFHTVKFTHVYLVAEETVLE